MLGQEDLYSVGVVGYLHKLNKAPEGFYQVLMSGTKKFEITGFTGSEPYLTARVREIPMALVEDQKTEALLFTLRSQFQKLVGSTGVAGGTGGHGQRPDQPVLRRLPGQFAAQPEDRGRAGDPRDRAPCTTCFTGWRKSWPSGWRRWR